jgi:hypothetical protein
MTENILQMLSVLNLTRYIFLYYMNNLGEYTNRINLALKSKIICYYSNMAIKAR